MKKIISFLISLILLISLIACGSSQKPANTPQGSDKQVSQTKPVENPKVSETPKPISTPAPTQEPVKIPPAPDAPYKYTPDGQLKVHFIDVGQADAILIHDGPSAMLIDAGNNEDATKVVNYIKQQGITKLDYLIATHPHEDHIGGLDAVINSFDIGNVFMPKVTANTNTFSDVVTALKNKNLLVQVPKLGELFDLPGSQCTIMAPNSSTYEDTNDYSVVIKLVHGNVSFLLTGDAAAVSEMEMVKKGYNLSATVLKVGHHGSKTSSSANFLSTVKPKYAVISVGKGNDYGHPTDAAISRLKGIGAQIFRTDEAGTIIATSDKTNVTFNAKPSTSPGVVSSNGSNSSTSSNAQAPVANTSVPVQTPPAQTTVSTSSNDRIVYYTEGGKSYHYSKNCSTLSRSKNILEGKLRDVINLGKSDPCDRCVK